VCRDHLLKMIGKHAPPPNQPFPRQLFASISPGAIAEPTVGRPRHAARNPATSLGDRARKLQRCRAVSFGNAVDRGFLVSKVERVKVATIPRVASSEDRPIIR
jgi:hypothetical protein